MVGWRVYGAHTSGYIACEHCIRNTLAKFAAKCVCVCICERPNP